MSKLQGVIYIGTCAGTYIYADCKVYSLAGRVVLPQVRRADAAGSTSNNFWWVESAEAALASWQICLTSTWLHTLWLSAPSSTLFAATSLHSTLSQRFNRHLKSAAVFYQLGWFSIALLFWKVWFLSWFSIAFVLKVWLWCSFLFFSFFWGAGHIVKDSVLKSSARTDLRSNWEEVPWCQHCEAW